MGLMFDDNNEVVCPQCGCHYFHEKEEYMLDKIEKEYETTYVETERRFALRCAECNHLIASNMTPKVIKQS